MFRLRSSLKITLRRVTSKQREHYLISNRARYFATVRWVLELNKQTIAQSHTAHESRLSSCLQSRKTLQCCSLDCMCNVQVKGIWGSKLRVLLRNVNRRLTDGGHRTPGAAAYGSHDVCACRIEFCVCCSKRLMHLRACGVRAFAYFNFTSKCAVDGLVQRHNGHCAQSRDYLINVMRNIFNGLGHDKSHYFLPMNKIIFPRKA